MKIYSVGACVKNEEAGSPKRADDFLSDIHLCIAEGTYAHYDMGICIYVMACGHLCQAATIFVGPVLMRCCECRDGRFSICGVCYVRLVKLEGT